VTATTLLLRLCRRTSRRDQSGASLVLVLAVVAFLAVLVPAILGLVALGPRITKPVVDDRRELYAASSAIDAAIELGRRTPTSACRVPRARSRSSTSTGSR
jgi:Tfp pilus assembly protein PilX